MKRKVQAVGVGIFAAAAIGGLATLFRDDHTLLVFIVFAGATLGPAIATALLVLEPSKANAPARLPGSIEQNWWQRASSQAFVDLMIVVGVALFAVSVADLSEVHTGLLFAIILLIAWTDVAIRLVLLRRAEG